MAKEQNPYLPPHSLTESILKKVALISEQIGRLSVQQEDSSPLRLRRLNRIRTVQGSLAIEGNTLTLEQITAVLEGKRVIAPPREIMEARNAFEAYDQFPHWRPESEEDMLAAHRVLMKNLIEDAGKFRKGDIGVLSGEKVIHIGPQFDRVPMLVRQLLNWLDQTEAHPLISSSVFHYEFEFIHPFTDGNGRMGRLWQTLILYRWNALFAHIPVESIVHEHQAAYYEALSASTAGADSAPFIEFLLSMILNAIEDVATPQVTPHVTPQVGRLLATLEGEMSRDNLMEKLGLKNRKYFREHYLSPALEAGLIEMTIPDKPRSRLQKYRLTLEGRRQREIESSTME